MIYTLSLLTEIIIHQNTLTMSLQHHFKSFIFLCLFVSASVATSQSILIVDNNFNAPTGNDIYSTLQEAADAASAGDTIYVQPSPTKYGTINIEKELHLIGIGFNLDKDLPHLSVIADVYLWNNVDNTSNASGSTIQGLELDFIYPVNRDGVTTFTLDNVKVFNCLLDRIHWITNARSVPISNLEMYENVFNSDITFPNTLSSVIIRNNLIRNMYLNSSTANSAVISNNLIYGLVGKNASGDNVIIQNNNFVGSNGFTRAFGNMLDAIIANNIFYGNTPSTVATGSSTSVNFQRNVFSNNLTHETGNNTLPPAGGGVGNSGDNNLEGLSPLLTDVPVLNVWEDSYDFTLLDGSPVSGAGSDDSDIGITGGPYPFTETNLFLITTAIPTIQSLNANAVINPGDDLNVRIRAKSN